MKESLTRKILASHLVDGNLKTGEEIGIRIDQTLTQDATGTLTYLQFESMGIPRVRTKLSVSYVDHNTLQSGFENADDHQFLRTVAAKYGIYFSRPGNGICHQVHRERFGVPGATLIGSDSHTPTAGGLGMISMGAGGLDVAVAMAGKPYYLITPEVVAINLTGSLGSWVSGKDLILELLRRFDVKWGKGKVLEYIGPGVAALSISDRFTITNMGAELGLTTSIFPSDDVTKKFLKAQGRIKDWKRLVADDNAEYASVISIDLSVLEPLVACPHSPGNVKPARELGDVKISQVCLGSCTNSSYKDLFIAARMLKGKVVLPEVSLNVSPGSRQVFLMMARSGLLEDLIASGARILESACGPCIGMGQAPPSGSNSIRTFNRNFEGRSGTKDANIYLASPEVCAASALTGAITDPRDLKLKRVIFREPLSYLKDDKMIIPPPKGERRATNDERRVIRGPNIKPMPKFAELPDVIEKKVLLKTGDNITTDHIMPAGAKILPLRSNIPAISEHVFVRIDPEFPARAKKLGGGVIIGGTNYGQGSSREHAAVAPRHLGVTAVITKSFARIHLANLINFGIIPLTFADPKDYGNVSEGDDLEIKNIHSDLKTGRPIVVANKTKGIEFKTNCQLTKREREILLAGGLLNYVGQG